MELTLDQLPELAAKFESLSFDNDASRELELFGGAFVWSDERPTLDSPDGTISITRFFQYLLWYRKSLIEESPVAAFSKYWDEFRRLCPNWPGFRAERCDPVLRSELDAEVSAAMAQIERVFDSCERRRQREWNRNVR